MAPPKHHDAEHHDAEDADNEPGAGAPARGRRGPRKATPKYLRNAALHYIERYAPPSAQLRRMLMNRVERSARAHGTDREQGSETVESLIGELQRLGLLDDAAYARSRARSLQRRGNSARAISAGLAAKGVAPEFIDAALAALRDEAADPELAAALAYARKRRIGPYRPAAERAEQRTRDLAALGRRGFAYELARRLIDTRDLAGLEAEAGA